MSVRKMTPKTFARAAIKNGYDEFLSNHMQWLQGYSFLEPLLTAYKGKEIDANACVGACREALLMHEIQQSIAKAKKSMQRSIARSEDAHYTITIYCKVWDDETKKYSLAVGQNTKKSTYQDEQGLWHTEEEDTDMVYEARMYQFAERIAALKLSKREDAVFAEIENNYGPKTRTTITRDQALGLVYPKEKTAAHKRLSNDSKPLKNYMRAKNSRSIGPWSMSK